MAAYSLSKFVKSANPKAPESRYSILVAGEYEIELHAFNYILSEMCVNYMLVNDAKKFLAEYKNRHYDLLLIDINMPNPHGIDIYKKVREIEEGTNNHIKIIEYNSKHGVNHKRVEVDGSIPKTSDSNEIQSLLVHYLLSENIGENDDLHNGSRAHHNNT